jgi:hypothetical protein
LVMLPKEENENVDVLYAVSSCCSRFRLLLSTEA